MAQCVRIGLNSPILVNVYSFPTLYDLVQTGGN